MEEMKAAIKTVLKDIEVDITHFRCSGTQTSHNSDLAMDEFEFDVLNADEIADKIMKAIRSMPTIKEMDRRGRYMESLKWDEMDNPDKVLEAIKEHGEEWVIAAMVDGSIGYHTPDHARAILHRFLKGEREDWCERCDACFAKDLTAMIGSDIYHLEQMSEERRNTTLTFVASLSKLSEEAQGSWSMLYPTHAP